MNVREEALRLHSCGYNCAQSVLAAMGAYTGLDQKTALALSGGLGGGVRCGEICGAINGAVIALGLAFPYQDGKDAASRARIAKLSMALTRQFQEQFGYLRCADLKGARIPCDDLIAWSAEAAEKMILENK